jgi:mannose-6-phosphate isomerase-like protein (cupin superfamily)
MREHGHQDPPGDEDQPEVNQTVGQHGRQRRRAMQPGGGQRRGQSQLDQPEHLGVPRPGQPQARHPVQELIRAVHRPAGNRGPARAYKTRRVLPPDHKGMTVSPVNLNQALATFTDIYSPRIVGRVNDYDIRIAHARGEHVWHVHDHTDEFFLVLDGRFDIALRDADGERTVSLGPGEIFVVPRGTEHKPSSPGGAILMFEPSGTSSTGDRHEGEIPAYVDSTTGRDI